MDESEFRRILELFPVVRSRDYKADSESLGQSTSQLTQNEENDSGAYKEIEIPGINQSDVFWDKLKLAAEKKVGAAEAEKFCKAFQRVYKKLVYEALSFGEAQNFANAFKAHGP